MKNSFLIIFVTASLIASLVYSSTYVYSANSEKLYPGNQCTTIFVPEGPDKVECCAFDYNLDRWCTTCDATNPPSNCSQRELQMKEQPPTIDDQPTKSGDSVFPTEDGKAVDDQQPNPRSPLTDQRVLPGNEGVLEQSEETSSNEGNTGNILLNGEALRE